MKKFFNISVKVAFYLIISFLYVKGGVETITGEDDYTLTKRRINFPGSFEEGEFAKYKHQALSSIGDDGINLMRNPSLVAIPTQWMYIISHKRKEEGVKFVTFSTMDDYGAAHTSIDNFSYNGKKYIVILNYLFNEGNLVISIFELPGNTTGKLSDYLSLSAKEIRRMAYPLIEYPAEKKIKPNFMKPNSEATIKRKILQKFKYNINPDPNNKNKFNLYETNERINSKDKGKPKLIANFNAQQQKWTVLNETPKH